jgi:hypothetical protein
MKRERSGISLLLGFLLGLSMLISFVHGKAATANQQKYQPGAQTSQASQENRSGLATLSPEEIITAITPLAQSRSIEKLVEKLQGIPASLARSIIQGLIHGELLPRNLLLQVIYGLSLQYPEADRSALLDMLFLVPQWDEGIPLLIVAAYSSYPQIIKSLIRWADTKIKNKAPQSQHLKRLLLNAFNYAVEHNKVRGLLVMRQQGVPIKPQQATRMLLQAKDPLVARFFIEVGADVNSAKKGITPLIQAVRNGNIDLVKALIANKAAVNAVADPAVGSALQAATQMQKKDSKDAPRFIAIEEYLRKHGAKE